MSGAGATGLYGKLPWAGDFLRHGLPLAFADPWDRWLSEALATARDRGGTGWAAGYVRSPVWRFSLDPGVIGKTAWTGVLASSLDRVGREFPLTLATNRLPPRRKDEPPGSPSWLDRAEAVALDLIQAEQPLDEVLARLQDHLDGPAAAGSPPQSGSTQPYSHWWHAPWPDHPAEAFSCYGLPRPERAATLFGAPSNDGARREGALR